MRSILGIRHPAMALLLAMSGCFTLVDVDRFHTAQGSAAAAAQPNKSGEYLNLTLSLAGMTPHVTQLFEYRVIDANNFIQSRGVLNPLGAPDVTVHVPLAIPKVNGPFRLDCYADVNNSGGYDGIGSVISNDHAWRIDPLADYPPGSVSPVDGLVQVKFTHNTSFTDINQYPSGSPNPPHDTGLAAAIHVANAGPLHGVLIQVRVIDMAANRTVGLFRVPRIVQAAFDMTIPGVVENGVSYDVLVYVDANGNGIYDNPAAGLGDFGWRLAATADTTGLSVRVEAQTTGAANVDVGAP
jgi:hypothetical protein